MQLFQQKFLQKISFWKTFPPHKNHNTLQINKLKIFPENFSPKPPSTKYFFSHTPSPIHHQSIASIKPTSSTATTSPKNAVRDGRLWQMFQATHKQASAIPSNPPLSPPAIQQESTKPQFFLKYYQSLL